MRLPIYDGDKPYIFISYAHKDADVVFPVIDALQRNGFRVWFDQGIEAGTEWPEYIASHIEKSSSVIVFMSEAAATSKNCRREINYSIEIDKEPLVIYLEQVNLPAGLKLQLNTLQAMFKYRAETDEHFINELCKAKMLQCCREAQEDIIVSVTESEQKNINIEEPLNEIRAVVDQENTESPETVQTQSTATPNQEPTVVNPQVVNRTQSTATSNQEPTVVNPHFLNQNNFKTYKKKSNKKAIIVVVAVVLAIYFVIGLVVTFILFDSEAEILSGSENVMTLRAEIDEVTDCEIEIHYDDSEGYITLLEMRTEIMLAEKTGLPIEEIESKLGNIKKSAAEKIEGFDFASSDAYLSDDVVVVVYTFDDLEYKDNAQVMMEDFFGYSNSVDGRIHYTYILTTLESEGFVKVD